MKGWEFQRPWISHGAQSRQSLRSGRHITDQGISCTTKTLPRAGHPSKLDDQARRRLIRRGEIGTILFAECWCCLSSLLSYWVQSWTGRHYKRRIPASWHSFCPTRKDDMRSVHPLTDITITAHVHNLLSKLTNAPFLPIFMYGSIPNASFYLSAPV